MGLPRLGLSVGSGADGDWECLRLIHGIENALLDFVRGTYDLIQWPGVVVLMALETVVFLIPSEAGMPLAGWLLIKDKGLGPEWLVLAGLLGGFGSTLGAWAFYYLGARGGRPALTRYGRYLFITEDEIDSADRFFRRWGGYAVFFGRMVPLVRSFVSIPAGIAKMDVRIFSVFTFIGSSIWAGLLAAAGYLLGENYQDVRDWLGPADIVVAAAVVLLGVVYVVHNIRKSWEAPKTSGPEA